MGQCEVLVPLHRSLRRRSVCAIFTVQGVGRSNFKIGRGSDLMIGSRLVGQF